MTCYKKAESASCIDHITALKGKDFIVLLLAYSSFILLYQFAGSFHDVSEDFGFVGHLL